MSPNVARIAWGSLLTGCVVALVAFSTGQAQNEEAVPVESLVPQQAVLYVDFDGTDQTDEPYSKTAAHKALVESGLMPVIQKMFDDLSEMAPVIQKMFDDLSEMAPGGPAGVLGAGNLTEQADQFTRHLTKHGGTVAVSLAEPVPGGPPVALPQAIVILKEAGRFTEVVSSLVLQFGGLDVNVRVQGNRSVESVIIPDSPGVEVAWWKEGTHLVLTAGINASANHIAVINGDAPNLMSGDLWKEFGRQQGFNPSMVSWLDLGAIRDAYGPIPLPIPSPEPVTVNTIADALGLGNLGAVVTESGFKGEAAWNETHVQVQGQPEGLLALADQSPFTLKDLPPLPVDTSGFVAVSFDAGRFYDTLLGLATRGAKFGPPDAAAQVEAMIAGIPQMIGFDPQSDLFQTLGSTVCFYLDGGQPVFLIFGGPVLAVEVKDAAKLRQTIDHLVVMAQGASDGELEVQRTEKQGREILMLGAEGAQAMSLCVDDNWLILSLVPQSIETFAMRLNGKLDQWVPGDEVKTALADLPDSFTSIAVTDPRPMYRSLVGMAPTLANFARVGIRQSGMFPPEFELPINMADLPPAELVTQHLFPNVAVGTTDAKGFHSTSRTSLPSLPFIGEMSGAGGIATAGALTALLLPAVQSARTAARRSQSRNNLKQIGLALHNHHEVYNSFPAATIENKDLKPEERLSWLVSLLPFIEQAPLFDVIDREQGWKSDDNADWMAVTVPTLVNPQVADDQDGVTHYVGIAGVGKDAATLPINGKGVGAFGYNRKLRLRDVTDGISNTMCVTEASKNYGSWGAGGKSTLRSLTRKPYINGPDGIGSPFPGGLNVLMLDGSVRFLSENIDPEVMEALVTIRGQEVIEDF